MDKREFLKLSALDRGRRFWYSGADKEIVS